MLVTYALSAAATTYKLETDQTKVSKTTTNANSVVIASGGLLLLRRSDLPSWQVANLPTALISFGASDSGFQVSQISLKPSVVAITSGMHSVVWAG
jgi:hypothetical protein